MPTMPINHSTNRLVFALLLLALPALLSACNLGSSSGSTDEGPPTLAPRASATPPPTLGYAGSAPDSQQPGLDVISSAISTPASNPDVEVFKLLSEVDQERLMQHVRNLEGFYTRHVNSSQSSAVQGIGAARDYIKAQFKQIQDAPNSALYTFAQPFDMSWDNVTTRQENVVAVVQGYEVNAGWLIVGAHYDSIGPSFNDGTEFAPGANDNGSGVAAIIELARILSQANPRASIMFVAFAAEEVQRVGSKRFVEYLRSQTDLDVIGMINIDTIGNHHSFDGRINDTELRVFSVGPNDTSASRHMARTAEIISFTHGLDMKLRVEDAIDREDRYGDHFSFSEAGYPAIRFINAFEQKRNGDPTDTVDFVEPDYLRRAVQSILMVVKSVSDGPRPPRSITLREPRDGVPSLKWEPVDGATSYLVALRPPNGLRYERQIMTDEPLVTWDGFRQYEAIAIAARDENGVYGPLSPEYRINP
jgi:bacterial leucyl aminopeptidase